MYCLLGYRQNYSETSGSLWLYSKDEASDFNSDITDDNNFKSFEYKTKLLGNTFANGILKSATIAVPLKYLSSFWKSLEMPWINCIIRIKTCADKVSKYCILSLAGNDNANNNNIIFTIEDTKAMVLENLCSC